MSWETVNRYILIACLCFLSWRVNDAMYIISKSYKKLRTVDHKLNLIWIELSSHRKCKSKDTNKRDQLFRALGLLEDKKGSAELKEIQRKLDKKETEG